MTQVRVRPGIIVEPVPPKNDGGLKAIIIIIFFVCLVASCT